VFRQPTLLAALETLIEDAIRGDPESPLRWVSRGHRNIVAALTGQRVQSQPEAGGPIAAPVELQLSGQSEDT
jgi:hypothetical protein